MIDYENIAIEMQKVAHIGDHKTYLEETNAMVIKLKELIPSEAKLKDHGDLGGVSKCVFCGKKAYKEGASYCDEHMNTGDCT